MQSLFPHSRNLMRGLSDKTQRREIRRKTRLSCAEAAPENPEPNFEAVARKSWGLLKPLPLGDQQVLPLCLGRAKYYYRVF